MNTYICKKTDPTCIHAHMCRGCSNSSVRQSMFTLTHPPTQMAPSYVCIYMYIYIYRRMYINTHTQPAPFMQIRDGGAAISARASRGQRSGRWLLPTLLTSLSVNPSACCCQLLVCNTLQHTAIHRIYTYIVGDDCYHLCWPLFLSKNCWPLCVSNNLHINTHGTCVYIQTKQMFRVYFSRVHTDSEVWHSDRWWHSAEVDIQIASILLALVQNHQTNSILVPIALILWTLADSPMALPWCMSPVYSFPSLLLFLSLGRNPA